MIKRMIVMLLLVGLVLGGTYGFARLKEKLIGQALAKYAAAPQTVSAVKAGFQDWQPMLAATATLRASQGVDVTTELPGIVAQIDFDSGQDVAAGTVLLRLRPDDGPSRLQQLQAMADLANVTYQRDLRQFHAKVVSQAQLDTDLGNLKSARAQVDAQQALLNEKIVRAPFAGRLGLRRVDIGQYLNPGTPIVTLQALDPIYADFYVPQQELAELAISQPVTAQVEPYSGQRFTGTIAAIDARVDTGTRNIRVRATLSNPDHKLLPGMSAAIEVMVGRPQRKLTLPQTAITFNPYGSTVYLVAQDGTDAKGKPKYVVHSTLVKTGARRGDQVAIINGIHPGDTVVTAGQVKLRNGTAVVIDNTVQPDASANPTLPAD